MNRSRNFSAAASPPSSLGQARMTISLLPNSRVFSVTIS